MTTHVTASVIVSAGTVTTISAGIIHFSRVRVVTFLAETPVVSLGYVRSGAALSTYLARVIHAVTPAVFNSFLFTPLFPLPEVQFISRCA